MADRSISELVHAASAGDQQAWHQIVDGHARLVWSVVRSHRLGDADAGDVFQSTWLRLIENLHRIDQPERLASWLATTARRECLRLIKQRKREVPEGVPADVAEGIGLTESGPDISVLQREEYAEVAAAYQRLSDECQALLRLCIADPPLSYAEIAEILGSPVGSIGPRRGRCLARLREFLDESPPTIRTGGT